MVSHQVLLTNQRKIPKISQGFIFFEKPFWRGLFLEGLICVSKSIGLAVKLKGNLPFLLCFTLHLGQFPSTRFFSKGALYLDGLTHGGA